MHIFQKNIRRLAKRQLKYNHLHWKKMKKELFKQIMDEVMKDYDSFQAVNVPIEALVGIED